MTKISVSLPDELANELRDIAPDDVSAFVSAAVRAEIDRRRLFAFLGELDEEMGPADEAPVARYSEILSGTVGHAAARDMRTA